MADKGEFPVKIAILTAMEIERREIAKLLSNARNRTECGFDWLEGRLGANEILPTAGGIGKVNAALTAAGAFHAFHPDALLSTGCAGGLAENLALGDIIAGSSYAYHDVDCCAFGNVRGQMQGLPPRFPADGRLLSIAQETGAKAGLMVSGDQFITPGERLEDIRKAFPEALACEMESAAIAQACYLAKVPFLSLRVISDTPGGAKASHLAQYENFWQSMAEKSFGFAKIFLERL